MIGVLFVLGGYLLPKQFTASTSITIDAPPARVFPTFSTQDGIQAWWKGMAEERPPAGSFEVVAVEGPKQGKGAKVDFVLDGKVTETWAIVESVAPDRVAYEVDFKVMLVQRTITLEAKDGGTLVTWAETAEIESPTMRYFSTLMGEAIVRNFELALRGAKRHVESQAGEGGAPAPAKPVEARTNPGGR